MLGPWRIPVLGSGAATMVLGVFVGLGDWSVIAVYGGLLGVGLIFTGLVVWVGLSDVDGAD